MAGRALPTAAKQRLAEGTPASFPAGPTASHENSTSANTPLSSAATSAGPLVTTSVDEGAAAQQVLKVLDNYDFRIYGQGMMAGADAVPLTPPSHEVLYQPTPEDTNEAPLPSQLSAPTPTSTTTPAAAATTGSVKAAAVAPAAAAASVVSPNPPPRVTKTASGTPALPMQPLLPRNTETTNTSSSSSSKLQEVVGAAAAALPPVGTSAAAATGSDVLPLAAQTPSVGGAAAAATAPSTASNTLSSSTTKAQLLKQELQQQTPAVGTPLIATTTTPTAAPSAAGRLAIPASTTLHSPISTATGGGGSVLASSSGGVGAAAGGGVLGGGSSFSPSAEGLRNRHPTYYKTSSSGAQEGGVSGVSGVTSSPYPYLTQNHFVVSDRTTGTSTATPAAASDSSGRGSGGGGSGGIMARVGGWWGGVTASVSGFWRDTKTRVQRAANWVVDEVIYALWVVLQWIGWLLVAPIKAVFAPWYRYNRSLKQRSGECLSQPFDIARLQELLGALPSWLSGIGGATEDLGWLNTLLAQVWPTLDPVVCELVCTSIEPLLDDMKPPFIAKMGFQRLTLGELPVVLDGIRLVGANDSHDVSGEKDTDAAAAEYRQAQAAATSDDRLEIEVDFHWVGEPNISFFVELALAGPYTRLVPKVSNLTAQGTLRLGLTRLVPQLPGFGALLIAFQRVPQIKFTLDFGPALGGKMTAKPVANFLDPFLRDTLASLLVWPNRFVVPLLARDVTGNLDTLALHSVGVLEVEVLSAHHLPKKGGVLSTVDPQVEMWTQPQHHVHTAVKKNRRNPKWRDEVLEVLVQEPDSQVLRVVMHDIDLLNIQELFRLNVIKGVTNTLRSANPIGWASLPLKEVSDKPFGRQEIELRLAGSEWAYELGVVGEEEAGSLSLAVTYKPFKDLDAASSAPIHCRGALFVTVRQCQELPAGDWDSGQSDPYVLLKVAGQKQQTVVMPHTSSPIYNSHHEFFNVQLPDVLTVQVYDSDFLKPDDLLGQLELPVKTVLTWTQGGVRGMRDGWWRLKHKKSESWDKATGGRIEMKLQFRPYST